jgi:O-antigen/teichoic acid export membrane protein
MNLQGDTPTASAESPLPPIAAPPVHRSFFWMMAGNGTFSLAQWARIAVVAKLASPVLVGVYALALALVSPVFMLSNLHLRAVQATDVRHRYDFADFVGLRLICSGLALVAVAALTVLAGWGHVPAALAAVLALGLAADSICEIFGGLQQKHERLDRVGMSLLLRASISTVAFALLFRHHDSLPALIGATSVLPVVSAAVLLAWDLPNGRQLLRGATLVAFNPRRMRELALFSLPLGVVMMLISLNVNIPRYALVHFSGRAQLGIFASLSYVVLSVQLVVNGLGQSVSTRLARHFAAGRLAEFRRLVLRLCGLGALLGVAGTAAASLIGRPLLLLLYRPEYAAHLNVFLVLFATSGIAAVASFLGYGITAAHAFRNQVWTLVAAVCTTSVFAYLLVPHWRIMGAAVSLLLSAMVQATMAFLVLRRALRTRAAAA